MVSMAKSKKKRVLRKKSATVKAIPTGFRTVSSYLTVSDGKNAIEF